MMVLCIGSNYHTLTLEEFFFEERNMKNHQRYIEFISASSHVDPIAVGSVH